MNLRLTYLILLLALSAVSPLPATAALTPKQASPQDDGSQWSYQLPYAVKQALDGADRSLFSPFLAGMVELQLPDCSGIFSKKQAEMILAKFLSQHHGLTYSVCREEALADATLTIGRFAGQNVSFGVYLLTQSVNGSKQIKQFRIEEQK